MLHASKTTARLARTALVLTASHAAAQSPTVTINPGDLTIIGTGDSVTIPTGLFPSNSPFVAWRFTSDFSQLNDTFSPTPNSVRCSFTDADGNPISPVVDAINSMGGGGADVAGFLFASSFTQDPANFSSINLFINPRSQPSFFGVFENPILEFFTADDVPDVVVTSQPLPADAPAIDVDLGYIAVDGDNIIASTDDQDEAWEDPRLALFTGDGTPLTFGPSESTNVSQFTIGPDTVETAPDGSFTFRRLGPGDYAIAVMNDWDEIEADFLAVGDNAMVTDAILTINGTTIVIAQDTINSDPNTVGWIRFAVGAREADFNSDGSADNQDILDYLSALVVGADFNADDTSDIFDLLAILAAIDEAKQY